MKKIITLLLALTMMLSLAACGGTTSGTSETEKDAEESVAATEEPAQEEEPAAEVESETAETRTFTDSLGREVELPAQIDKVALSGPLAQIVLFPLCPDKLVGLSTAWSADAEQYLDPEYFNMPEIGQLYGGKGELNLETLLASEAQVVIDVGQPKDGMEEDLDALQEQTGIPFVHVSAYTDGMGEAYRALGELVGMEEDAEELAAYCEQVYDRTVEIANSVEKVDLLYVTGEGLNVIAKDSYHSELIDLLANNLAVVDEPSSKGTGNEVDMEQIMAWNPDYIIFEPNGVYDTVVDDPNWQTVTAIQSGNYYEAPMGPYNWMGFPPSVQRLLGMMWMAKVLYPDAADYDLYEEVATYYQLFYHCELTESQYDTLVANSIGR